MQDNLPGGAHLPVRGGRLKRARVAAFAAAGACVFLALVSVASAHPLGNFTINHYASLVVAPDEIRLDVVLDLAEIPTFKERQRIDTDGNGDVSSSEIEAERQVQCGMRADSLRLTVAGEPVPLEVTAAGLSFPSGAGGLFTMRVVCEFRSGLAAALPDGAEIGYQDVSYAERLGWREIVVQGDGMTIKTPGIAASSSSSRLTTYPQDLLAQPLNVPAVVFAIAPGGPSLPSSTPADAAPLDGSLSSGAPSTAPPGAVPGGVGGEIAGLLNTRDLTVPVILLSILSAMALGAGHAVTPGHGKTIMAAYLVGTRGTVRHALALGLTVTISHTLGVLGLAFVILALGSIAPDQFSRSLAVVSGLLVVGIGLYLLIRQFREIVRGRRERVALAARRASAAATREPPRAQIAMHRHDEGPGIGPLHNLGVGPASGSHAHDHGFGLHEHAIPADTPLTWRSLVVLGLFGGLVPSINALIILLATVATGRAAFGLVLVIAFGIGMALVLGGIGIGLVYAARWMARTPSSPVFSKALAWAPLVTALIILVLGVYLTTQALLGTPIF